MNAENEYRCNICHVILNVGKKSPELLEHIKTNHKEVFDVHKENPEATVGFHIQFLHLNMLKDDDDSKAQPVIIGEVCEAPTEEIENTIIEEKPAESHLVVIPPLKKKPVRRESESRKKSWVWKYFTRLSNIIYRCNMCEVVLSIKGCNTNNMNRHVRSKHPTIYQVEIEEKKQGEVDVNADAEILKEDGDQTICVINEIEGAQVATPTPATPKTNLHRRSWIWLYFERVSSTLAQCKLCHRNICHGGNATGNMNRHLKMRHNKTSDDHNWIWKVFDNTQPDFFACQICQYRCMKFSDVDKSISYILHHLKLAHGVVSGEQIITSIECE